MHIAFDAKRLFHNFTGLGNYSRTLVRNLVRFQPDFHCHLYTPRNKQHPETQFFQTHPNIHIHTAAGQPSTYWRSYGIKRNLKAEGVDVFHGLSHEIPIGMHRTNIPSIVTIHDLIFKYYPDYFPFLDRKIYDWKFRYACEHADSIIAISESTKADIIKFYDVEAEKISVIYQTCGEQFKQILHPEKRQKIIQKYELPSIFLLYVGSIIPRKNLLKIVQALPLLPKSLDIPLVVIGDGKAYKQEVLEYIKVHKLTARVLFPKVNYQDLAALYQQASVFLYPSVYEGFGIPILEALYSKTPVITCTNSSLSEAGGKGAYYVEPQVESIAEGIEKVLSDTSWRQQLLHAGQQHLTKFDSARLTQQLVDIYQQIGV